MKGINNMTHILLGIFDKETQASNAVTELQTAGFDPKNISVVMRSATTGEVTETRGSTIAEGAVSGATKGGVLGALAGLLIGVGAITVPGIGGLLIGGPLAAALGLTGAAATTVSGAVTGALAGGLVGGLTSLGVPEDTALEYERRIKAGAVLVAVETPEDHVTHVREVLSKHGAEQIESINVASRAM